VLDALRWLVKTGAHCRYLPHDFPPWHAVYQQARRWLAAGAFGRMAHDLRMILRLADGREANPTATILDSRTLQSTPESGGRAGAAAGHGVRLEVVKHAEAKRGFVLLPRRWVVERSFAWAARFRRLARDYERLAATLAGWHWVAFLVLALRRVFWESS